MFHLQHALFSGTITPMRGPQTHAAFVMFAVSAVTISIAAGQSTRPAPRPAKKDAAIKEAVAQLIDEARTALHDQKLPANEADFAKRFGRDIPNDDVLRALTKSAHQHAFIDAYERWQLTSFDPPLPELSDEQMRSLMASAPAMVDNPRAEERIVMSFEQAEKDSYLSEGELQRLRTADGELDRRTQIAEAMNKPAEGWREWIAGKLAAKGPRRLQWLIERCAATASAGWPVRAVKAKLTRELKKAGSDSSLTAGDRDLIAADLRRLIGLKRRAINQVTFLADGSISATFYNNAVDEDDVEKWISYLHPIATQ